MQIKRRGIGASVAGCNTDKFILKQIGLIKILNVTSELRYFSSAQGDPKNLRSGLSVALRNDTSGNAIHRRHV